VHDALPNREESLIRSIATKPEDLSSYIALANLYRERADYRKAEFTLRRVIEIDPLHLQAWADLGTLYGSLEEWRNSAEALERACALDPQDPSNWIRYGAALLAIRDIDSSTRVRDLLLAQFPGRWEGHLLAGHLHKIHGEAAAAVTAYRRALDINSRQTDALYNLVDLSPPDPSDPLVQQLEALRSDPAVSNRESSDVLFALARIEERFGEIERAMLLYREANAAAGKAMRELGVIYDPERMEAEAARIVKMFNQSVCTLPLEPPDLGIKFIFITGMPRSGTTLIERILSSHAEVTSGGELPFMQECLKKLLASRAASGRPDNLDPADAQQRQLLLQLREHYLDRLFERDLDGDYVIDKLPANFAAIGLIRVLFPEALFIHSTRNPLATCWSLYSAHFGMHLPYNARLTHLAHYYQKVYSVLMQHWQAVPALNLIEQSYDELVADPESQIRALVERCGLPWDENCLRFHENPAPVFTANMLQVRQPVSFASAKRWQRFDRFLSELKSGLTSAGTGP
jgi:tetratricopeptide (TPR) repeat protein